jgi:hypothetical protein
VTGRSIKRGEEGCKEEKSGEDWRRGKKRGAKGRRGYKRRAEGSRSKARVPSVRTVVYEFMLSPT